MEAEGGIQRVRRLSGGQGVWVGIRELRGVWEPLDEDGVVR